MLFMGRLKILRPQGQMELALAQIVLLGMIPQPGQLQPEVRLAVTQKLDEEASILRLFPAHRLQSQSLLVERQGFVQVGHIEIKMVE